MFHIAGIGEYINKPVNLEPKPFKSVLTNDLHNNKTFKQYNERLI